MISPHFRYALDFILRRVKAPVACGHSCYKTQILKLAETSVLPFWFKYLEFKL